MPVNQAESKPSPKPYARPKGGNRGLTQAYQFRDLAAKQALELADSVGEDLENKLARAKALQALCVVWSDGCDRIRIIKGRPLPGSLRPIAKPKKPKVISSAPSEEPSQGS
jgi:hypothetical protein